MPDLVTPSIQARHCFYELKAFMQLYALGYERVAHVNAILSQFKNFANGEFSRLGMPAGLLL
jgi:hypothetical protein